MTTIINTTKIPCRAKDPHTCPYHGAELQSEAALKRGDYNAYAAAQAKMAAAVNSTPEIKEFFAQQAASIPATQPIQAAQLTGLEEAQRTFGQRYQKALNDIRRGYKHNYQVGGEGIDLGEPEADAIRHHAQREVADQILRNARTQLEPTVTDKRALEEEYQKTRAELATWPNQSYLIAYDEAYAAATGPGTGFVGFENGVDTAAALRKLDELHHRGVPPVTAQGAADQAFQQADQNRATRLKDHFTNGNPYLVGGTVTDVENAEFTAARLVYQRAANTLIKSASYLRPATGDDGYVVDRNDFDRAWHSVADATLDNAILDEIQPAGDLDETRRTLDQVGRVISTKFKPTEHGHQVANLNNALRSLDLAYWNAPHGPARLESL